MPTDRMLRKYIIDRKTGNIVVARSRKIMQFSVDYFVNRITDGRHCFICGLPDTTVSFTEEHVIPKWVTRHFGTEKSHLILHNGGRLLHSRYTIPCCTKCNNYLSEALEKPVSSLLKLKYDELSADIDDDQTIYSLLFQWCALIFFKMHLKDQFLPMSKDPRTNGGVIGELHAWEALHQVLTLARINYTGAIADPDVYGSIIVLPRIKESKELFDYLDSSTAHTMMIQVGETVIFAVLNDSKACLALYKTFLSQIDGPMTEIQCRELFARLRYANDNLKIRPRLKALITRRNEFKLQAIRPWRFELCQESEERVSLFSLMRRYIGELVPNIPERDQILSDLENGKAQYILDCEGKFFQHKDKSAVK